MRQNNPAKKFILDLLAGGYLTYENFLKSCKTHIVLSGLSEEEIVCLIKELELEGEVIQVQNCNRKIQASTNTAPPYLILLCSATNAGAILCAQDRIAQFDANFAR